MISLKTLTNEELQALCKRLKLELSSRANRLEEAQELMTSLSCDVKYLIEFIGDRSFKVFFAEIVLKGAKVEREFFNLGKNYPGDGTIIISEKIGLVNNHVYEKRDEKSRAVLFVYEGKIFELPPLKGQVFLGVKKYLQGDLTKEQMLEFCPGTEDAIIGVPHDLQD